MSYVLVATSGATRTVYGETAGKPWTDLAAAEAAAAAKAEWGEPELAVEILTVEGLPE